MKKNTLVKFDFDNIPVEFHSQYPFSRRDVFVYLGDIVQMPGHCILIRMSDGKGFAGYHTDEFVRVPDEEA